MSWADPEQNEFARLEDLIDQNRLLTDIFRPWPMWYFILETRWPDFLALLGWEYNAERNWPWWVDYEGAVIFRTPLYWMGEVADKSEAYETEQSIFVPDDMDYQRPLLPQEEYEDALYIRNGVARVYMPGERRPAGKPPTLRAKRH